MTNLVKTAVLPAKEIEIDDWIKIGGQPYRITDKNTFVDTVRLLAELDAPKSLVLIKLEMDESVPLTVYNQKI